MAELIECRECSSPYCRGCNLYILSRALHDGKFNCLMNANKLVVVPKEIAPVRHGRWEESYMNDFLVCSECVHYWIYKGDQYDYHYCPNCGAKMDKEETE